ncbi:MAG TPA: hypothetical protein V6D29_25080 [Leptolyngbyaceae cyanobacterium]
MLSQPLVPVAEQTRLKGGLKDIVPVAQNPHSPVHIKAQNP